MNMGMNKRSWENGAKIIVFILASCLAIRCESQEEEEEMMIDFNATAANLLAKAITQGAALDASEKAFDVTKFGAKPGNKEDMAEDNGVAFIQAFKAACNEAGKARMVIPKGEFLIGSIILQGPCKGHTVVQVKGTVKASTDLSNFPGEGVEWISFENIQGLIVTGGGTFDGQGADSWKYIDGKFDNDAPGQRLPANVLLSQVTGAVVRDITSLNSKGFHYFITRSRNIRLNNLNISAPGDSPNTDGIHISQSDMVKISQSVISTGDDCIGIIRGARNISIKKVTCGPGHGISVGSLGKYDNETDVRGIVVKNCTLVGTDNGLRIKTYEGKNPSEASNVIYEDIIMQNVKNPIIINQLYGSKKESIIKISDIQFKNIKGTSVSKVAVDLHCSRLAPCKDVRFTNINLSYAGIQSKGAFSSSCINAQVAYHGSQTPPPCR